MPKERRHAFSARRHAAIMFTDIVGYTALMGSDEDQAFETLSKNREIHKQSVTKFNGTLIKEIGDGMLISFNLASEAVYCAIEIQKKCKEQDIPLKIGIHEGEMVIEGADVLGDAVNVASRLESGTQKGCIYISGSVYRDIKNRSNIQTRFIKEKRFKNVDEPIKVYEILCEEIGDQSNSNEKSHGKIINRKFIIFIVGFLVVIVAGFIVWKLLPQYKTPELEKTIAVLPFINQSESDEYAYFGDALTDEIIQNLQNIEEFKVRSYTSVMKYKDLGKSAPEIAEELKVNYVIEGRTQRYQNNCRISVRLIHAKDDEQLWGETYNKQWRDIIKLQSDLSIDISKALVTALTPNEIESMEEIPTENLEAYEYYLKARNFHNQYFKSRDRSLLSSAILLYQQAIDLDPDFALAYVRLGNARFNQTYWDDYFKENFADSLLWYADKALDINPNLPSALTAKGYYFREIGSIDRAIFWFTSAIERNQNYGMAYRGLGLCYDERNLQIESIKYLLKSKELLFNDFYYPDVLLSLGLAYHNICDIKRSERTYLELVKYDPLDGYQFLSWLIWTINDQGRYEHYTNIICSLDSSSICYDRLTITSLFLNEYSKAWYYRKLYNHEMQKSGSIKLNEQHRDGYILWMLDRKDDAMKYFDRQIKYCKESIRLKRYYANGSAQYDLAGTYAFLGEKSKAYDILYELEDIGMGGMFVLAIPHDPLFENLWDHQEFKDIIARQEAKYAKIRAELDQLRKKGVLQD